MTLRGKRPRKMRPAVYCTGQCSLRICSPLLLLTAFSRRQLADPTRPCCQEKDGFTGRTSFPRRRGVPEVLAGVLLRCGEDGGATGGAPGPRDGKQCADGWLSLPRPRVVCTKSIHSPLRDHRYGPRHQQLRRLQALFSVWLGYFSGCGGADVRPERQAG